MNVYADISFLASLYTLDAHSPEAARRMRAVREPLISAALGELELVNALGLRLFRREITRSQADASAAFQHDVLDGVISIHPVSSAAYEKAVALSRKRTPTLGVRSLDLLHVACALTLDAERFWSFDTQQRKLAAAEGLAVS